MEKHMYFDYARSINEKLRSEVNGYVKFKVYIDIDAIIFTINFKDFDFEYAIKDIEEKIYAGDSALMAETILKTYRAAILSAFFKTDKRKERDNKKKLGFMEEYV